MDMIRKNCARNTWTCGDLLPGQDWSSESMITKARVALIIAYKCLDVCEIARPFSSTSRSPREPLAACRRSLAPSPSALQSTKILLRERNTAGEKLRALLWFVAMPLGTASRNQVFNLKKHRKARLAPVSRPIYMSKYVFCSIFNTSIHISISRIVALYGTVPISETPQNCFNTFSKYFFLNCSQDLQICVNSFIFCTMFLKFCRKFKNCWQS